MIMSFNEFVLICNRFSWRKQNACFPLSFYKLNALELPNACAAHLFSPHGTILWDPSKKTHQQKWEINNLYTVLGRKGGEKSLLFHFLLYATKQKPLAKGKCILLNVLKRVTSKFSFQITFSIKQIFHVNKHQWSRFWFSRHCTGTYELLLRQNIWRNKI